jgi:hypothetical protein
MECKTGERQTTHSAECWRWHHGCAVARAERMEAALTEGGEYLSSILDSAKDGMRDEDDAEALYEALEWIDGDARTALAKVRAALAPADGAEGNGDAGE